MPVTHAAVLGIIQGLTEVFPISSSAHLVIIPWLLKWHYQGLSFDVALHAGTALALVIYFFNDWVKITHAAFARDTAHRSGVLWYIMVATIPGAVAGLILEKKAETLFRSPLLIAAMLALFAVMLWLADYFGKKKKTIEQIDVMTAVVIGLAQAVAIIPGVSRSGITMTAGLFKGYSREAAARFSFLLATPIIIAAGVLKLPKLHVADLNAAFWAGMVASAVSAFFGIRFFLAYVRKAGLDVFVLYRIAAAIAICAVFFTR
jgi:undecaprenyl-diphosphatase